MAETLSGIVPLVGSLSTFEDEEDEDESCSGSSSSSGAALAAWKQHQQEYRTADAVNVIRVPSERDGDDGWRVMVEKQSIYKQQEVGGGPLPLPLRLGRMHQPFSSVSRV